MMLVLALFTIYLGLDLYCVTTAAFVGYCVLIGFIFILFVPFELLRWLSPWSAYFGGVGFSYRKGYDEKGINPIFMPYLLLPWTAPLHHPFSVTTYKAARRERVRTTKMERHRRWMTPPNPATRMKTQYRKS